MIEIPTLVNTFIGAALGYFGWKVRKIETKLEGTMQDHQVRVLIDDKHAPIQVLQGELKGDLLRIEKKLDSLIAAIYALRSQGPLQ